MPRNYTPRSKAQYTNEALIALAKRKEFGKLIFISFY